MASLFHCHQGVCRTITSEELPGLMQTGEGWIWADFHLPDPQEELLAGVFHFHPLALEDAHATDHPPKIEEYPDHLFIVLQSVESANESGDLATDEISFFLSERFLVTAYVDDITVLDPIQQAFRAGKSPWKTPDRLMHHIMDLLVDRFRPFLEKLGDNIEDLESGMFSQVIKRGHPMKELLVYNRQLLRVKRMVARDRELLNRLARDPYPQILEETSRFLRDVYDELVMVNEMAETYQELLIADRETHLALINNRLSKVMKVLAGVSVIFLPLNLMAGLYGTNFHILPGADKPLGFWVFVGLMGIVSAGLAWYFRRIKWL